MEGETASSINAEMHFGERALPTLDSNIKSGNSLIDLDFYDTQIDFGEEKKIKPFNWQQAFPNIFSSSLQDTKQSADGTTGFDVVIGNPPYVRIQTLKDITPESVGYFKKAYKTTQYGNYDLYVLFVERGLSILNNKGTLGFILPNKFFNTDYGIGLRKLLIDDKHLNKIIDFGANQVFDNATTYCCLLFLGKEPKVEFAYTKTEPVHLLNKQELLLTQLKTESYFKEAWNFRSNKSEELIQKLYNQSKNLIDVPCEISRGSSTGNDKVFVVEEVKKGIYKNGLEDIVELEKEILKRPVYATDFSRYTFKTSSKHFLIFPYDLKDNVKLMQEETLKMKYPLTYQYLKKNKSLLEERAQYQKWFLFSAPRSLLLHSKADIIIPLLADRGLFAMLPLNKSEYTLMAGGGFSITILNPEINKNYMLGLLNSKLLFWVLQSLSNIFRGGWITCTKQYFSNLPIKTIDKYDRRSMDLHNLIVDAVSTIQKLTIDKQATTLPEKIEQLNQRIAYTDEKINKLVYEMYGLSEEEIGIVEGR